MQNTLSLMFPKLNHARRLLEDPEAVPNSLDTDGRVGNGRLGFCLPAESGDSLLLSLSKLYYVSKIILNDLPSYPPALSVYTGPLLLL